jgi:uncharacterized membrane protein YkoI
MPPMPRAMLLCAFVSIACGTETRPGTETPEPTPTEAPAPAPTQAVDVAAPAPKTGTAVHAEIVATARDAKGVEKVKLRTDASGVLVKQAVYHLDESRVPEPVKALAKKEFPGGKAVRYETEIYADIGAIFEVEVQTKDGKRCEVAANAEGVLRYKECRVKPKELPVEVTRKLGELHPKGKILEAETKKGPDVDEITVELKEAGREFYVRLQPDGTVLETLVRVPAVFEVPL